MSEEYRIQELLQREVYVGDTLVGVITGERSHPRDEFVKSMRLEVVDDVAGEYMRKNPAGPGRALGLAAHTSFRSYVAQVAEVSVTAGTIRVHKILCVVDCGGTVNPDIVHSQMEGSIMFGLTAALHGELSLRNGAIAQANFDDYPILQPL